MSYTDYAEMAEQARRYRDKAYREGRRAARDAARYYEDAAWWRWHARWLTARPELWDIDSTPARAEELARVTVRLADSMLRSMYADYSRARSYAGQARMYEELRSMRAGLPL